MTYSEKANEFKTIRSGRSTADTLPAVMADLPAGSHVLRVPTKYIGITGLFTNSGKSISGQLWGKLRSSGHAVPIPDSDFVLSALTPKHKTDEAGDLGKYISNMEILDVWMFSSIWPQITTGLGESDGTVDILVTEGVEGELVE